MPASIPYPPTDGTLASGTQMNANLIALLSAVNNSMLRDGTLPMMGNLSFGGNKGTNLANATLAGDAVAYGQLTTVLAAYAPLASPVFTGTILGAAATLTGLLTLGAGLTVTGAVAVTGTVAATGIVTSAGLELGFRGLPQNAQAASYQLALTDRDSCIYMTGAGSTLTVPANATVAFPFNPQTVVVLINNGSGVWAITRAAGVIMKLAGTGIDLNRTLVVGGVATLTKVGTDTWFINGVGLS